MHIHACPQVPGCQAGVTLSRRGLGVGVAPGMMSPGELLGSGVDPGVMSPGEILGSGVDLGIMLPWSELEVRGGPRPDVTW